MIKILTRLLCFSYLMVTGLLAHADADKITIQIKINGLRDSACQLAYYFGNKQYIKDSLTLDHKGQCVIENDDLPGGIYLFVLPGKKYFEFLVNGHEKKFSLETSIGDPTMDMKISGSLENKVFYKNIRYVRAMQSRLSRLSARLNDENESADSIAQIKKRLKKIENEVKASRIRIVEDHPELFYSSVIRWMKEPKIPKIPILEDGTRDSLYPYRYYKKHFFDDANFDDARILRTPVYLNKIKKYMKELTARHPDSLIKSADYILSMAKANPEVFKFSLVHLLNKYANSKIMGMDAVYVHLVDNYYAKGEAVWIDSVQLYRMVDNANTLRKLLIGKPAYNLVLKDTNGIYVPLYQVKAKYTILCFWDPDCGHCKKAVPKLKSVYDSLKHEGVMVYAVNTETDFKKWRAFIDKYDLDWINVADIELRSHFRSYYDIRSTPKIFLLDKDKKIAAKRLGPEQLGDFLGDLIKEEKNKALHKE